MNPFLDLADWPEADLKEAVCFLSQAQEVPALGDLDDCPDWVRTCALDYISQCLDEDPPHIEGGLFQPRTNYEKRQRAKMLAVRAELFDRHEWLRGTERAELREQFGRLDAVPDWVAESAARNVKQQIFNLSTGQRLNPAERLKWRTD